LSSATSTRNATTVATPRSFTASIRGSLPPGDEPYYPVSTAADQAILAQYRELAKAEPNVYFGGRLGNYAYLDMDQTIASALGFVESLPTL
jgi:UDP-galactopyranose mutase